MNTYTEEMLEDLKLLIGDAPDGLADYLLRSTGTKVLNLINQPVMPVALQGLVVEMAADAYRMHQSASGTGESEIASISDNGQTVSYRASSYQAVLQTVASTIKNYEQQLEAFRKSRW